MSLTMTVHTVLPLVYTDGPGPRTSVYFAGCSIGRSAHPCLGCQSRKLWPTDSGSARQVDDLARELLDLSASYGHRITLIGGEPLDQAAPLAELIALLRDAGAHLVLYSGYTYEELLERCANEGPDSPTARALFGVQTLVDGRFDQSADDDMLQYRGSRNQRVIDIAASKAAGCAVTDPSWDQITLTIVDGQVIGPVGVMRRLAAVQGQSLQPYRQCGRVVSS